MPVHNDIKCADCVHLVPQTQVCMEYKASVDAEVLRNCYFFKEGKYAEPVAEIVPIKKGRKKKKTPFCIPRGTTRIADNCFLQIFSPGNPFRIRQCSENQESPRVDNSPHNVY